MMLLTIFYFEYKIKNMKILFLSPIVPYPLTSGDQIRAYKFLKFLHEKHSVHLICFSRNTSTLEAEQALKKICDKITLVPISQTKLIYNSLLAWFTPRPLNVAAFRSKKMFELIAHIVKEEKIDVIHAHRLRMAEYALSAAAKYKVLDYTDSLARYFRLCLKFSDQGIKKSYLKRELKCLASYEPLMSKIFDGKIIISPRDQEELYTLGAEDIKVIPNGVDFFPAYNQEERAKANKIVFVGNMRYMPNLLGIKEFCEKSWSLILQAIPQASLIIIGPKPKAYWLNKLQKYPRLEFKGVVPDLLSCLQQARVAICPVELAVGRQTKVLEYLSAGVPTVTTKRVGLNITSKPENIFLIAQTYEKFAKQVIKLYQDRDLAVSLSKAGQEFIRQEYAWEITARQLHELYANLDKRG